VKIVQEKKPLSPNLFGGGEDEAFYFGDLIS